MAEVQPRDFRRCRCNHPSHGGGTGPFRAVLVGGRCPRPQWHGRAGRQHQRRGGHRGRGLSPSRSRRGTWPDTAKFREDLAAVLSDRLALGERLSERERVYPLRRGSAAHLPGSDVRIDNEASETATVLEVRAPDEIGLLHRITAALFDLGLDVVSARVSTLGEMVVDAFYVRESGGSKVTDASRLSGITRRKLSRNWDFREAFPKVECRLSCPANTCAPAAVPVAGSSSSSVSWSWQSRPADSSPLTGCTVTRPLPRRRPLPRTHRQFRLAHRSHWQPARL